MVWDKKQMVQCMELQAAAVRICRKEGGQQMYKTVNGEWTNDDYSKSKTVRLYPETLEVIEGYRGRNFSEKLRNLVKDFARQNQENVRQDGGNKTT